MWSWTCFDEQLHQISTQKTALKPFFNNLRMRARTAEWIMNTAFDDLPLILITKNWWVYPKVSEILQTNVSKFHPASLCLKKSRKNFSWKRIKLQALHTHLKKLSLDPKESMRKASCPVTSSNRNTPKLYTSLISETVPDTPTLKSGARDNVKNQELFYSTTQWKCNQKNFFTLDLGKCVHWTFEMDLLLVSFQAVLRSPHLKP